MGIGAVRIYRTARERFADSGPVILVREQPCRATEHLLSPDCQQIKSIPDGKDFFSV
jgi:hypothetical protein